MVPRERQREEIASDYYYGGMVVERSGKLHPALYYQGLLDGALRRVSHLRKGAGQQNRSKWHEWRLETGRGVVEATRS